ncbi:oxidosqualene:lanosterol cyclase-like protein [Lophium mytilinum]|uniref:Terpene cyclase/mutase family member n=1 Tax=Lophium mytilinum TaxID=390894 RepID=A0A6A6QY86_9PEZI|nr:oxidosqualene:lanosterol cyclase-like protein [Lophium mytilinum]
MAHTKGVVNRRAKGEVEKPTNGHITANAVGEQKTDYSRWRLKDDDGCQTWHYLETDEELKAWPQSTADKYHLGLETGLPKLPAAKTPLESAANGLSFFSHLQLPPGNWACEYGGPMFLLPCAVITWYVTETPVPEAWKIEIKNYLYARQNPEDGGWGLHIEGESSVFGTSMNYVVLRLLGAGAEDPRIIKARGLLHEMGGAVYGPHWAKFWLAVLGIASWDLVNPVPPEFWLLPDWVPLAPWRWWIHMRMVFLPMSYVYSKRWQYPLNDVTRSLQQELFTEPVEKINFLSHRNSIHAKDNYHPKSWLLNSINWGLVNVWNPYLRPNFLIKKAENWVWWLVQEEDHNTEYSNLGPVNGPMNTLVCYIQEGPDSYSVQEHRKTLPEFLWVKGEGMLMNGTNGVQVWDTAFLIQACVTAGFAQDPKWKPMLIKALEFLEAQQIREEVREQKKSYRQSRKGAWGFSTKKQGYTVSDCTSEALKAVMLLQNIPGYPQLISAARQQQAIDVLLTMQNPSGGCASYEPTRGPAYLEWFNAAEVFGRIMIEYDYPECTTAVVGALSMFTERFPDYRTSHIADFKQRAVEYIRTSQHADGSWYGSWGICFTYAGMFALEALASVGENYENSERVRRACRFFLDRQMEDGGWGETYKSCETGTYCQHAQSQVVQTAWVCIALLEAGYPEPEPLKKALGMVMGRQCANGEWKQEAIEGVFNKSCMISYPNYKFTFTIKAMGMFAEKWGNIELL